MIAEPFTDTENEEAIAAGECLQGLFEKIQLERMSDMPVINPRLAVAAVDFRPWQDSYLGALVTPWFMNLVLLPQSPQQWDELAELSKKTHVFPSGQYTFITGQEDGIGKYQMCSLFSPMFDFADHAAALETAGVALQELLNEEHVETPDIDSQQIENIWNGVEARPDESEAEASSLSDDETQSILQQPSLEEKLQQPLSRREVLRGALFGGNKNL